MNPTKRLVFILLVLCSLGGILFLLFRKDNEVHRAFYYWKSTFQMDSRDKAFLDSLQVDRIYMKYFDVTWNAGAQQPVPVAMTEFISKWDLSAERIPVVYITNEVFVNMKHEDIPALARHVSVLINEITEASPAPVREVQFDCDWTPGTKEKYFQFLKSFKPLFQPGKVIVSATIRLHQVKYHAMTGVPPVDRGMLMFYNMGKLDSRMEGNSIFDAAVAEGYIDYLKSYPLALDYALPVFSWAVHIRKNKIIGLENNMASGIDSLPQLQRITQNTFLVKTDGFFYNGTYFMKDDRIRVEESTPEVALKAAGMLAPETNSSAFSVSLYNFNASNIRRYEVKDYHSIYDQFR